MDSKVFQCCYTNAVRRHGDTVSTGWQTVAVSPDIPREAYAACSKLQNANSSIQAVPKDESGDVLKLTEIYGDGACIYVLRTVYGLVDDKGRPNMFSHAYIFPLKDGPQAIEDPNIFLSLDGANFKDSEEAAESWDGRLTYLAPLTLDAAMERAGIDGEEYIKLLRCVYAQFSEKKAPKPLYVQYDGTAENMRAILYCVYYGLPYGIRRMLKIASCPSGGDASKNLIFSRNAGEKGLYVDPATGENNILTGRVEKRIDRCGFIDHAARELPHGEFAGFFSDLDRMTESLGDPMGQNELAVKLAYTLLSGGDVTALSDGELEITLSDTLRLKPTSDERVCGFIAKLVGELDSRALKLSDENELTLSDWITSTDSAVLRDAGTGHSVCRLFALTDGEAAEKLAAMPDDSRAFYISVIRGKERGQAILEVYFDDRLRRSEADWASLRSALDDSAALADPSGIRASILQKAEMLYTLRASEGVDPVENLNGYLDVLKSVLPPEECRIRRRRALEEYWQGVSYDNFTLEKAQEYLAMHSDDIPQSRAVVGLLTVGALYDPNNESEFFLELRRLMFGAKAPSSAMEKAQVTARLKEIVASCAPGRVDNFEKWVEWTSGASTVTQVNALVALRAALIPFNSEKVVEALGNQELVEISRRRSGGVGGGLTQMIERECDRHDTKDAPLPIDLWLKLGGMRLSNPFDIFDSGKACVLSADPAEAARESRLLRLPKYRTLAENYVRMKGGASKAVRRWLGEAKDIRPDRGAEPPHSGRKGLFGKK